MFPGQLNFVLGWHRKTLGRGIRVVMGPWTREQRQARGHAVRVLRTGAGSLGHRAWVWVGPPAWAGGSGWGLPSRCVFVPHPPDPGAGISFSQQGEPTLLRALGPRQCGLEIGLMITGSWVVSVGSKGVNVR